MVLPMKHLDPGKTGLSSASHPRIARRGPIILMYHAIDTRHTHTNSPWAISLDRFESHLDLLLKLNAKCIELEAVVENRTPPGSVCITFDDGYADNLDAARLLHDHGMTATFFVVTGAIGGSCTWEQPPLRGRRMMNENELIELTKLGMQIGSHSVSHAYLTKLPLEQQELEVFSSRSDLAAILGKPPKYFAYPSGDYSEALERIVAAAGYEAACSTRSGFHRGDTELFNIRRLSVYRKDSSARMARKLLMADNDGSWRSILRMRVNSARGKLAQRLGHEELES